VSAYVLATRALFDFRHYAFHGARRIVAFWLGRASSDEERLRILRRLPRRTLAGIASDARVEQSVTRLAAGVLLERRWPRLLRRAMGHRTEADKWLRIATLRIFAAAGWHVADSLLRLALADADRDVAGAAVAILGERDDRASSQELLDALESNSFQRSRIAVHLDGRDIAHDLLRLLEHADEDVRYWAVTLLAPHAADREVELALASSTGDPAPQVRAAVAKAFRGAEGGAAAAAAVPLLRDPEWLVRAQAARTLSVVGDARIGHELVPLLRDGQWWVRTAAKETLATLGAGSLDVLVPLLADPDEFARNGAAEVLLATGAIARWADESLSEPDDGPLSRLLAEALSAGGPSVQHVAESTVSEGARAKVARLLARPAA
jgi:HEAT repeat protein